MDRLRRYGLPVAFVVCFLAVGVPYWSIPYSKVSLPDTLMAAGMVVVVFAALALRLCAAARVWQVTVIVGAAVPAAVLARVTVEVASDPTSHNLWPLEIIIALLMGLIGALAGAVAGSLAAKLFPGRTKDERP